MNSILATWNSTDPMSALETMLNCCGSRRWAASMVDSRPITLEQELHETADRLWNTMAQPDWLEAFACHPRIGERTAAALASSRSSVWSGQEQSSIQSAADTVLASFDEGNARYENRFGFTYIVCATGKSSGEMLSILERRLGNNRETELREAAEQQRQILHIRLRKWLGQ
jgi:2-oxo-4-hydroxy-4-carboxy-5-ureidoimidazoline decarboxylase